MDQEVNTVAVGHDWQGAAGAQPNPTAPTPGEESNPSADPSSSWLLSLDDARAARSGSEPIVKDDAGLDGGESEDSPASHDTSWTDSAPKKPGVSKLLIRGIAAAAVIAAAFSAYQAYRAPRHSQPWTKPLAPSGSQARTGDELATPATSGTSTRTDARTGLPITPLEDPSASIASPINVEQEPTSSVATSIDVTDPAIDAEVVGNADASATEASSSTDTTRGSSSDAFPAIWPVHVADGAADAGSSSDSDTGVDANLASPTTLDPDAATPFGPRSAFANMTPIDRDGGFGPEPSASGAPSSFSTDELEAAARESRTLDVKPEDMAAAQRSKNGLRVATPEDLAGIWEGNTIPLEAVDQENRVLTPHVGRVRIFLKGREVFEGRLYAIGQGKVWIDTELGRMALFSEMVHRIEQLSSPDGTPVLGERGSQELAGLPRVRVRSLGGVFFGKIIARDETSLTMITDEGARVTLESTDFEPAPKGSVVVVKRKL